jgi:uncharacterized membrane protein YgcG
MAPPPHAKTRAPFARPGRGLSRWLARRLLAATLLALLLVVYAVSRHRAPAPSSARFIDETGRTPSNTIAAAEQFLAGIMLESGVDVRVRIVRGTHGQSISAYALDRMRADGLGRDVDGRGLLSGVDDSAKEARIEVGPISRGSSRTPSSRI